MKKDYNKINREVEELLQKIALGDEKSLLILFDVVKATFKAFIYQFFKKKFINEKTDPDIFQDLYVRFVELISNRNKDIPFLKDMYCKFGYIYDKNFFLVSGLTKQRHEQGMQVTNEFNFGTSDLFLYSNIEEKIEKEFLNYQITSVLNKLTATEKYIIEAFFGIIDVEYQKGKWKIAGIAKYLYRRKITKTLLTVDQLKEIVDKILIKIKKEMDPKRIQYLNKRHKYYQDNKERLIEEVKQYQKEHNEQIKQYQKEHQGENNTRYKKWYDDNKEQVKNYYEKNKERIREVQDEYQAKPEIREKKRLYLQEYRKKKKEEEIKKQQEQEKEQLKKEKEISDKEKK